MIPKRTAAAERGKEDLESAAEEGLWRFEEGKRCGGAVEPRGIARPRYRPSRKKMKTLQKHNISV
ncbi:hypothetical protein Bca4012_093328 [Brassica carinata]|uniref:Uncharacterized protein n=1 Tax=Brassica carinata TaxID=52824 RepID=A0A8X7PT91_BRACI|nr:hypothetical protein Bca52824_075542 [Brassica carinata]